MKIVKIISCCLIDSFGNNENVLELARGVGCTILGNVLNASELYSKMVNFMLCEFCLN